jgi:hypothetical protein
MGGDETREESSPELDTVSDEGARETMPPETAVASPRGRARKSRTPKPPKAKAKAEAPRARKSRKSVAPKSVHDGAKTQQFAPGENPATKVLEAIGRGEDEISIPPSSGDLDEHEGFFAEGAKVGLPSEPPPRVVAGVASSEDRPLRPLVPAARRERMANVVKVAVAVCGVVCLAALVRVGLGHRDHGVHAAAAQVVSTAPAAPVAQAAPVAVAPEPAPPEEPSVPLKPAPEEREDARHALELGKYDDAIAAATRSITVDPTDAEAWLILGAADQAAGHGADARDAFTQCTKQAKSGNVYECGAMLSWNGPPR